MSNKINPLKKIARRIMGKDELAKNTPPFDSSAWQSQKQRTQRRVEKQQAAAHARAVLRKENAKPKSQSKKELKAAAVLVRKIEAKRKKNLKFNSKK